MGQTPGAKKSLGQHWLYDHASLEVMCQAAQLNSGDAILEIGPGHGTLTSLLVQKTKQVVAVEFDEKLAADLPGRLPAENLEVVSQDILSFDLTSLPPDYKVVANIPYYLTSHLIRVLSETTNPPAMAVLLVQKEVARRVTAQPGNMSLLSVTAQFYWQVSLGPEVPAKLFRPPPKVNSQVLIMRYRSQPQFPNADPKAFFQLVKAGFSQRRKILLNSLSSGLRLNREKVEGICLAAAVDPQRRPQTLSLAEWHSLYAALQAYF